MSSQPSGSIGLYDILGWLETNKKRLIAIVSLLIVAGFAIAIYFWRDEQNGFAANAELLNLESPTRPTPATVEELLKMAQNYSGTAAADRAILMAGQLYFEKGDYAKAKAEFDQYLHSNPTGPSADEATFCGGLALEAAGDLKGALEIYRKTSSGYPQSAYSARAKLAEANIDELQQQPAQALAIYSALMKSVTSGDSSFRMVASEVFTRQSQLLEQHPELAPTNAVTSAPAAAIAPAPAPAGSNAAEPAKTAPAPSAP